MVDMQALKFLSLEGMISENNWLDDIGKLNCSVDEKLQYILAAIECPDEYLELFDRLIDLLQLHLSRRFYKKRLRVYAFGSKVSGLSLKSSDLDLFINFEPPDDSMKMLWMLKKFINQDFHAIFSNVLVIYARVPIIRCDHELGFHCDISVDNFQALENSKLIKFYVSLNKSFYLFFMCVKFWFMRFNQSQKPALTSYAISTLCLFFLQQKKLAPPVVFLQSHPKCPPPRIEGGWNVSFLSDKTELLVEEENVSVFELLTDFFKFYSEFEFSLYIISPYLGEPILKPFSNPPPCFKEYNAQSEKYDVSKFLCVQDPFVHSFNPCRQITKKCVISFQESCGRAWKHCQDEARKSQNSFLKLVFNAHTNFSRKRKISFGLIDLRMGKTCFFGNTEEEFRNKWVEKVLDALESILVKFAVATVERKEGRFECQMGKNVLVKQLRKQVSETLKLPASLSNIERMERVSSEVAKLPAANLGLSKPLVICVLYRLQVKPTRLLLNINADSNVQKSSCFQNLHSALIKSLDVWVDEHLQQSAINGSKCEIPDVK